MTRKKLKLSNSLNNNVQKTYLNLNFLRIININMLISSAIYNFLIIFTITYNVINVDEKFSKQYLCIVTIANLEFIKINIPIILILKLGLLILQDI